MKLIALLATLALVSCSHNHSTTSTTSTKTSWSMLGAGGTNAIPSGPSTTVTETAPAKTTPVAAATSETAQAESKLAEVGEVKTNSDGSIHVALKSEILFDSGSAKLKPAAISDITKVAEVLKTLKGRKVTVEGHTDAQGNAAKNKALSERRAQAVRSQLVKKGVASNQVVSTGSGAAKPVTSNDTAESRAKNRRVELHIEKM